VSQQPIIVHIVEPKPSGLMDVVLGSIGLTGLIVLAAVISGFFLAGVLFWIRSRST
jgi:hypothetical protein